MEFFQSSRISLSTEVLEQKTKYKKKGSIIPLLRQKPSVGEREACDTSLFGPKGQIWAWHFLAPTPLLDIHCLWNNQAHMLSLRASALLPRAPLLHYILPSSTEVLTYNRGEMDSFYITALNNLQLPTCVHNSIPAPETFYYISPPRLWARDRADTLSDLPLGPLHLAQCLTWAKHLINIHEWK